MGTIILKWNPNFSSYTMHHYLNDIVTLNFGENPDFNWSVWDFDKIHAGDRFYFVKLGYGATGIVGCGTITSAPYRGEDWSGKGRKTYYVDFEPEIMINPDALPILNTMMLTARMPDFEWEHGHSGIVLTQDQAEKLDKLWKAYLKEYGELYASKADFDREINDYIYWDRDYDE